jgi:hypothetical protein
MQSFQNFVMPKFFSCDPLRDPPLNLFVLDQKMKGIKKHATAWCDRIFCSGEELNHQDLQRQFDLVRSLSCVRIL